jgi:hypothetical protein
MLALYRRFIAEDSRKPWGPDELHWLKFLSGCVLFDPPIPAVPGDPGLSEFCDALETPLVPVHLLTREGARTPPMYSPPLASVRDARAVEDLPWEAALLVITVLQRQPDLLQGGSAEEDRDELLRNSPDVAEKLRRLPDEFAPRRTLLDHEEGYTKKELEAVLDVLLSTRPNPLQNTQGGRPKEVDPVQDVEAAILLEHDDWKYEDIARHNGWSETHVSKPAGRGREILARLRSETDL